MTDNLDAHVRRLSRMTDEQVARHAGTEAREALLERIVAMPTSPRTSRRWRLRVPIVTGVAIATLAGTAAFGWELLRSDPHETASLQCDTPGAPSIIPSVSGDPVADCAAEWRRQIGSDAPALVAYDNGHGGVEVRPADQPAAPRSSALPPGPAQDVALIELGESLDDYVAGLPSGCYDTATATRMANAQLDRLGLTGWTVTPPPGTGCVSFSAVEAATRTIALRTTPDLPPGNEPFRMLATRLRPIARECLPLAKAAARVRAEADALGLDSAKRDYQLATVTDARRCTTIHETVGGTIFLTLRGPAG